jgi:hypothetical protein
MIYGLDHIDGPDRMSRRPDRGSRGSMAGACEPFVAHV